MRDITIHAVMNGYLCHVGCQQVVFESKASLLNALDRYLTDPEKTEHEFTCKAINRPVPLDVPYGAERVTHPTARQIADEYRRDFQAGERLADAANQAAKCEKMPGTKSPEPKRV